MDHRIHQLQNHPLQFSKRRSHANKLVNTPFQDMLQIEQNKLKISKHAQQRLNERNIMLNDAQWTRIHERVEEAKKKGVQDSLVLMNDTALIVNVKNNTVITAMKRSEANDKIFTNINGTILLDE